jgi:hypothetical protein
MRRRSLVLTVALGLAFGLSGAAVQPGQAQTGGARGPAAAGFTQLFISPCGEPYRGRPGEPYPVVLWFKQADLNHDGVIDRAEFRADHAGFFDALDADGDGVLEGPELAFYEQRVVPDILGPDVIALAAPDRMGAKLFLAQITQTPEGGHPGDSSAHGYQVPGGAKGPPEDLGSHRRAPKELIGAAAYGLLAEPEPVRAADTDLDGRVTKAEFLAAADRRFKLLDKRKDGKLTLDELPLTASQVQLAKRK